MDALQELLIALASWNDFTLLFVVAFWALVLGTRWQIAAMSAGILGAVFCVAFLADEIPLKEQSWDFVAYMGGLAAVYAGVLSVTLQRFAKKVTSDTMNAYQWLRGMQQGRA